ncbi:MAG TPA: hypothetical protein PK511_07965 [Chitinophagales bacterium]|nr:hypothetical protein [Chitinophagales bacterium]HMX04130.1 hypothetical protein [Chitinophagales bacterium]HMZ90094.1 hypothetical protein [Chitinophagales bacterium]HNA58480.1 hypothetical protein [Chitinophagales bacterium]HNE45054.1 hypothetical protein [Chitinophagales bacterium]
MKSFSAICIGLLICSILNGQVNLKDSCVKANIIQVDLGVGMPAFDMAERFGVHALVGGGYQYKSNHNWLFGVNGNFIYGSIVHEDSLMSNLRNEAGYVIGSDGLGYNPILWESGFTAKWETGKITNIWSINPNSGLTFIGGIGLMQHKIWIYIDETVVPQLDETNRKGYDRLSNGLMLSQFAGYYLFSNKYFVNFRGGIEVVEAFTQNRRIVNYDTQMTDDEMRFDMLINLKFSWNLPIYNQPKTRYYTN